VEEKENRTISALKHNRKSRKKENGIEKIQVFVSIWRKILNESGMKMKNT